MAYVLLVPAFLGLRVGYYLAHPVHRRAILAGRCPTSDVLSLDWFSMGILATGLPLALRDLGPWIGMNAVFAVGLFGLPRAIDGERTVAAGKLGAIGLGVALFGYANYGAALPGPPPAAVLGPIAAYSLSDAATASLLSVTNSLVTGPVAIAGLALAMNWSLTREELTSIPAVRHTLPRYTVGQKE